MRYYRDELLPGVFLTALQTEKFKNSCLSAGFLAPLARDTAASYGLIPFVLRRGTKSLPNMEALSGKLDDLFGSSIGPMVRRKGEVQMVGLRADFCDDAFLPGGEKIEKDVFSLVGEMLLQPKLSQNQLDSDYVESEAQKLVERLESMKNDKRSYAQARLLEEMCCFEAYGVPPIGTVSEAEAISAESLTEDYHTLISTAPVELFYCGAERGESVAELCKKVLAALPREELNLDLGTDVRMNAVEEQVRYFTEEMDVTQGNLALGYRLGDCMEEPDNAALRVFNSVFGGCATSKLFMNVREKLSLCYYASSGIDLHKGIMTVNSGIEFSNYEATLNEINHQLENMKKGEIATEELSGAKEALCNGFRAADDSPSMLEEFYLNQTLYGTDYSPKEMAEQIEAVTLDRVVAVAQSVVPDAVYFLKGEEAE